MRYPEARRSFAPLLVALLALSQLTPGSGWSFAPSTTNRNDVRRPSATTTAASTSPLFIQKQKKQRTLHPHSASCWRIATTAAAVGPLYNSAADKEESEDTEEAAAPKKSRDKAAVTPVEEEEEEESFGVLKTILLAGPLFVKFTIVLLIKFVTDLIVFPLLWLYRLARMTKRKFLKMIGKGERDYPNGEAKPDKSS